LKQYTQTKYSGFDWIGDIPEHWKVSKLFGILNRKIKKNQDNVQRKMLSVSQFLGIVEKEYDSDSQIRTKKESMNYLVVEPNDLVVNDMWIQYRGLGVSNLEGTVSPAYQVYQINSEKIVPRFLNYLVRSDVYVNQYPKYLKGIRPNSLEISQYHFTRLPLLIPEPVEQQQIADFLDKETIRIDSAISKNQKLVQLLEEKYYRIINKMIIEGFDPSVKTKNSGMEWVGDIPEHWKALPIKSILQNGKDGIRIGPFGSSIKLKFMKEFGYKIYGQENAIKEDFTLGNHYIDEEKFNELKDYEIIPGDIVISRMGTIGKATIVPKGIEPGIMHSHLIRIRANPKKCTQEFLVMLINSSHYLKSHFEQVSTGATMSGLLVPVIKSAFICLPPFKEQNLILEFLENEKPKIFSLMNSVKGQLEKLQEYRQALVSSAVTGKIDVRLWNEKTI